jgi:DNA-binding LacI/PurR family transcriptional regulator
MRVRPRACIASLGGVDGLCAEERRAAAARASLPLPRRASLEADIVTGAEFNEVSGRMAAASAFFAANDLMGIGAMAALRDAGVAVPRDTAVRLWASTTSSSPASFLRA